MLIIKNLSIKLLVILLCTAPAFISARDFVFTNVIDNIFTNPANWTPAYPGLEVAEGDRILIQGAAFLEAEKLLVNGTLYIEQESELFSPNAQIVVRAQGTLDNFGKLDVVGVSNAGRFRNGLSAWTLCKFLATYPTSRTVNLIDAKLIVSGDAVNQGNFENHGYVSVVNDLILLHTSIFNQLRGELRVQGYIDQSREARLNVPLGFDHPVTPLPGAPTNQELRAERALLSAPKVPAGRD